MITWPQALGLLVLSKICSKASAVAAVATGVVTGVSA
jgi:hypothetical protein